MKESPRRIEKCDKSVEIQGYEGPKSWAKKRRRNGVTLNDLPVKVSAKRKGGEARWRGGSCRGSPFDGGIASSGG